MKKLTICSFNVENLFGRYKAFDYMPGDQYKRKVMTPEELQELGGLHPGELSAKNSFSVFDKDDWRKVTAKALKGNTDNLPDIACLIEVEDMRVLRKFNRDYLNGSYQHALLIDSHDPRLIDIGILSKHEITDVKTHMDEPYGDASKYLFSRDCVEVTFAVKGGETNSTFTIFANHFKSKLAADDAQSEKANQKRLAQANRVAEIIRERYGSAYHSAAFAVMGDFNDTPDSESLKPLVKDLGLMNVVERLGELDRWTHWWKSKNRVSQIDYILLPQGLADKASAAMPYIERRGISSARKKSYFDDANGERGPAVDFSFERFPEVTDKLDASDHCAVFFEILL